MRRMSEELDRLLGESHDGITLFKFEGRDMPCIMFEEKRYDHIMSLVAGKPVSVDADLNILQDGLGHVFVEVLLKFSLAGITERILVNANRNLAFFEALAETSMIAITSPGSDYGRENVFVINLPRPDKAGGALEIIRRGLACGNENDGAVTGI